MTQTPLQDDIYRELMRAPLTASQAAGMVGTKPRYANAAMDALVRRGMARRAGFSPRPKPSILFEIVA